MAGSKLSVAVATVLALGASLGAARTAAGQGFSSSACGTENLLAGRQPVGRQDMRGDFRLPTDGQVAPEGAQWDAPVGVFFDTAAGSITWDLGEVRSVSAFMIQADANDTYKIFGAENDSPSAYKLLVEVDSVVAIGHGLRTRTAVIDPTLVRYLRVAEPLGDGAYSMSEFQAFCRAPTPVPPKLPVVEAPPAKVVEAPWWQFYWFENDASARFEMVLALLGCALIGWGLWLTKQGRPTAHQRLRDRLLMALGLISFACYFNFGLFHFRNYVHQWDTFHYYVGSKYFKELSYDRLYECVAVADSEEPGLRRRVELRKVMNLRTNMMEGTQEILAHPEHCKGHFTPERWAAFKHDVGHFRNKHDVKRWEEAQTDHGFNGSPVWNIVGTTLANSAPASDSQIDFLTKIDPLFIFGLTFMSWWAFGWRTTCVALAVFATNFPSRFYWTGGAFLRWDWLFYFVGGICLVKKDRPLLGGFFLGYSTLLRIFPIFTFIGPIIVIARQLWGKHDVDSPVWEIYGWRRRPAEAEGPEDADEAETVDEAPAGKVAAEKVVAGKVAAEKLVAGKVVADKAVADKAVADKVVDDKAAGGEEAAQGDDDDDHEPADEQGEAPLLRIYKPEPVSSLRELVARVDRRLVSILVGGALALAILFPISLITSSGMDGYRAFAFNTNKHKETPLTNYMGLRTVAIYTPSEAGRVLKNDRLEDPWGAWKKTKVATFHHRMPLYLLFVVGFVVILFGALRDAEPWVACAMGAMMMAVGVELTCYYYSFLFGVTFLYYKRHEVGAIMLGVTAATGFIDWAPTRYLPDTGIWANLKMSQWLDEQYMWMSVATLAGFVWIMYRFGYLLTPAVGEREMAAAQPKRSARGGGARRSSNKPRNARRR
jgi:hypothetical protein